MVTAFIRSAADEGVIVDFTPISEDQIFAKIVVRKEGSPKQTTRIIEAWGNVSVQMRDRSKNMASPPFEFEVLAQEGEDGESDTFDNVYASEQADDNVQPIWKPAIIPLSFELDKVLRISIFDWHGHDRFS